MYFFVVDAHCQQKYSCTVSEIAPLLHWRIDPLIGLTDYASTLTLSLGLLTILAH